MTDHVWQSRPVFTEWNSNWDYKTLSALDAGKLPQFDPKVGHYSYWIDIQHKLGTLGCVEVASYEVDGELRRFHGAARS